MREQEFKAGRYFPVNDAYFQKSGEKLPETMEQALDLSGADGTKSILDVFYVGHDADYMIARILDEREVVHYFGTAKPEHFDVKTAPFWDDIERGKAICFVLYRDGREAQIVFRRIFLRLRRYPQFSYGRVQAAGAWHG